MEYAVIALGTVIAVSLAADRVGVALDAIFSGLLPYLGQG
jgi:hypothetical protein